jgi:hypothetical protein
MAELNIVNVAKIVGRTSVANISNVVANATTANVLVNPANSSNVIKINSMYCHNYGNLFADVTIRYHRGGNTVLFANTMTIPQKTTLTILAKDMMTYLEEGDYITAAASANGQLSLFITYEQLS